MALRENNIYKHNLYLNAVSLWKEHHIFFTKEKFSSVKLSLEKKTFDL